MLTKTAQLVKEAFSTTPAGHEYDASVFGAKSDMYSKIKKARQVYSEERPVADTAQQVARLGDALLSGPFLLSKLKEMALERTGDSGFKRAELKHRLGQNDYIPEIIPSSKATLKKLQRQAAAKEKAKK